MANNWVYFMYDPETDQVKIGQSNNPVQRLSDIRRERPKVELIAIIPAHLAERELHQRFADLHTTGEWFMLDDNLRELIAQSQQLPPVVIRVESTPIIEAVQTLPSSIDVPVSVPSTPMPMPTPMPISNRGGVSVLPLLAGLMHLGIGVFLVGEVSILPAPNWNLYTVSAFVGFFVTGTVLTLLGIIRIAAD